MRKRNGASGAGTARTRLTGDCSVSTSAGVNDSAFCRKRVSAARSVESVDSAASRRMPGSPPAAAAPPTVTNHSRRFMARHLTAAARDSHRVRVSAAPAQPTSPLPDRLQRSPVVRPPALVRIARDVVPEELEVVAAVIGAAVNPALGQRRRECAELQRPDMAAMLGIPGAEVLRDAHVGDARLLFELPQRGFAHRLTRLDAALHQLDSGLRMFK